MLTTLGHRAYVRGLQGGPDLRAGYRAPAVVRLKHNRLERSLAKPLPRQARVPEDRPGVVPGFAGVGLEPQDPGQEFGEIGNVWSTRQFVAFALAVAGGEARRRGHDVRFGEECDIPDKYASDNRVLAGPDGLVPVPGYESSHLIQGRYADAPRLVRMNGFLYGSRREGSAVTGAAT